MTNDARRANDARSANDHRMTFYICDYLCAFVDKKNLCGTDNRQPGQQRSGPAFSAFELIRRAKQL